MANQDNFQKAVELIKTGEYNSAKTILYRVIAADPDHDRAWVAMYYCVPSSKDKRLCLDKALAINPQNRAAKKLIAKIDEKPAVTPAFLPDSSIPNPEEGAPGDVSSTADPAPRSRTPFYIIIVVCVIVIIGVMIALALLH